MPVLTNNRNDNLRVIAELPGLQHLAVPNGAYLKPFLVPRVVGTESHRRVQAYIRTTFSALGWKVEEDTFTQSTPLGDKTFNNIVATKFPEATRQLVLAAHYDSKYFPPPDEERFIGATDSSVPCAMLVDLATSLNRLLDQLRGTDRSVQIVFFDGEEAFVNWTHEDSIYGSRHLAQRWAGTFHPLKSGTNARPKSYIESIELMVLLDLLGAPGTTLRDLQASTSDQFLRMVRLEKRLSALGLLGTVGQVVSGTAKNDGAREPIFRPLGASDFRYGGIEDDHLPFAERGVDIVHLIATPFPRVWHTFSDNADALDEKTIRHLALVMRAFVVDYFGLAKL
ncbi:hypothetical protein THASP1DRAFT_15183 [Thamnocephalis sphaerospora]|uniref:Peptide hydrolase n=1 Tax=Thamnocephalis sphaerospora TaxID=78915 RepID=A0A4V1IW69_9FUNG|nr:hypothetical protein THASP1DRAFT_18390 [Thamnocephalis sphaerospora]RKP08778.1 hypothetical protein THASP1DRAFT_15183 [Thamnocephalis sphaerospora]|eukprot:RKP06519.1 hypothetical protein THASP1DRAFT_18390 [Thamnocephalis sphaerospora]